MGYLLFSGGIGFLIAITRSHKDISVYLMIATIVSVVWGLEMIVNDGIENAKKEIRREIEELRSEIDDNSNSSGDDWI